MKTEDLIDMLASGPDVRVHRRPVRASVVPVALGVTASAAIMLAVLGMRQDLALAAMQTPFLTKLTFSCALAVAGWAAVRRLSSPGARTALLPLWLALPVVLLWTLAASALLQAAPDERAELFWGDTWRYCPWLIALMSLPILAGVLQAMRGRAPTQLRAAGAAAGCAAGAAAATVYCLHCPEASAVFVGVWYLLGMLLPAALGALIGPRVLAW